MLGLWVIRLSRLECIREFTHTWQQRWLSEATHWTCAPCTCPFCTVVNQFPFPYPHLQSWCKEFTPPPTNCLHDDVMKWKKKTALPALCAGNFPVTGELPSQRPVKWSFDVFFDLRLNKRLSTQSRRRWFETPSRPLWRHYNVEALNYSFITLVCLSDSINIPTLDLNKLREMNFDQDR